MPIIDGRGHHRPSDNHSSLLSPSAMAVKQPLPPSSSSTPPSRTEQTHSRTSSSGRSRSNVSRLLLFIAASCHVRPGGQLVQISSVWGGVYVTSILIQPLWLSLLSPVCSALNFLLDLACRRIHRHPSSHVHQANFGMSHTVVHEGAN